jgi:hypothetical protein
MREQFVKVKAVDSGALRAMGAVKDGIAAGVVEERTRPKV